MRECAQNRVFFKLTGHLIQSLSSDQLDYFEDRIPLGIWEWQLAGDHLKWSAGLFRVLGLDPATTVPSFELYKAVVHPEDRLDFDGKPTIAISGKLSHRKFRIIRPSGEMRWIESHGQLKFGADGKASHMIGFAHDVTETHAALATHAAFTALLQAVRVLTGGRIWQTSPDGMIVDEIDWWRSIDRSRTPGLHWSEQNFVHPDDLPSVIAAWDDATAKRGTYQATFRKKQQDGRYETSSSVAVPVVGADGDVLGWIGSSKLSGLPSVVRYLEALEIPADLFRGARAILNLGADEFAALAGVSHSSIRRIEGQNTDQVSATIRQQVVDYLSLRGIRFIVDSLGARQMSLTPMFTNQNDPEPADVVTTNN